MFHNSVLLVSSLVAETGMNGDVTFSPFLIKGTLLRLRRDGVRDLIDPRDRLGFFLLGNSNRLTPAGRQLSEAPGPLSRYRNLDGLKL